MPSTSTLTRAPAASAPDEIDALIASLEIAVLVPCHNEALTIESVVRNFRRVIPNANVFVYDNCSTDDTSAVALAAGAVVRKESLKGKGNVVRRMFADVEADIYLMTDGDGTYEYEAAPRLIRELVTNRLDMVIGTRSGIYDEAHRLGHGFGNRLFNGFYRRMFGSYFSDIFSGYRVFSRRFVKSFPATSGGFEIETEMSVHASQLRMPVAELATKYGARPEGSHSKLNTFRDAFAILWTMIVLLKEMKPLTFFGWLAAATLAVSLALGWPILFTFIETGLVPRLPTAVLCATLALLSALLFACGLILDSVARGRLEQKRSFYLALPSLFAGRR